MNLNLPLSQFSRRQFLRRMGLATGAAATAAPLLSLNSLGNPHNHRGLRVIVVGAGVAGLCAAYELEQRGHEVVLLEASDSHIGGRVRTHYFGDGQYGELGAMRIPAGHQLTRHYVNLFGLSLRPFVQSNPEAYYYARGQKRRIKDEASMNQFFALDPAERTKSPFDLWDQSVLRVLGDLSAEEKADLRRVVFQTERMRALDRLSLEEVFKQAGLSTEAIEFLCTLWAYETALQTGITTILREELEEVWLHQFDEIVGGTQQLPLAFARNLRSKPRTDAKVALIEQNTQTGKVAAVYRGRNRWERVEGDRLLCTVPLPVMNKIEFAPGLSGPKQRAIRQITYDSSTKVLAKTRQRFWESEDGIFGGGTYTDLPTGITYYPADNAAARDRRVSNAGGVMLASYTWGMPARRMAAMPATERHQFTLEQLSKIHPQFQQNGMVEKLVSWSWDNHPLSAGAFCWWAPGQHETLYRHVIAPEGKIFFAGEHASLTHTWMQGAIESALRAVEEIIGTA